MPRKTLAALKADLLADDGVREAYTAMSEEYALARTIIGARVRAGLSQEELAQRMATSQPFIARLESGRNIPSMRTMQRVAKATGTRVDCKLVPA